MSIIWQDGFDQYTGWGSGSADIMLNSAGYTSLLDVWVTSAPPSGATPSGYGASIFLTNASELTLVFPTTTQLQGQFYVQINELPYKICTLEYTNGVAYYTLAEFVVNTNGTLSVITYNLPDTPGATLQPQYVYTSTQDNLVTPNVWHLFEFQYAPGATGFCTIRIDGAAIVSVAGVPTTGDSYAADPVNAIFWSGQTGGTIYIDDLILADITKAPGVTDWIGPAYVLCTRPSADTGTNQWTPYGGSGTHASCVNTSPSDEDVSYLSTASGGQTELFDVAALPPNILDVISVAVNGRLRTDGLGLLNYNLLLQDGVDLATGSTKTPSTSYQTTQDIYEFRPSGGTWTYLSVDAVLPGVVSG